MVWFITKAIWYIALAYAAVIWAAFLYGMRAVFLERRDKL